MARYSLSCAISKVTIFPPNGRSCMPSGPPLPEPGRDGPPADDGARDDPIWGDADAAEGWRPVPCRADWAEDPAGPEAWAGEQPPPDPEHDPGGVPDPAGPPPPRRRPIH